ncbi:MgtC/SapB family protein, partial [Burkholderia cenocepacia]|nr:MgtC/SapB family protein [Burkholderia cenocepacia]
AARAVREEELFVQWREAIGADVMLQQLMRIVESAGLTSVRCSTEN